MNIKFLFKHIFTYNEISDLISILIISSPVKKICFYLKKNPDSRYVNAPSHVAINFPSWCN